MSSPAPLNNPATGQFHGVISNRRELETAVMVKTKPTENAQAAKSRHYHAHPYFWMTLRGDFLERVEGIEERIYDPMVLTYHPQGEIHAHEPGPVRPSGFGIVMIESAFADAQEFAHIREEPAVLRGSLFTRLAHRIMREFNLNDGASSLVLEGLCLELIATASRIDLPRETVVPRWLLEAKDLLHASFNQTLKLAEIAGAVGIHPVHLGAEFRKHYGCTPGQYVRNLRLESAKSMLRLRELSVMDVALGCGFYDEAHFCRSFKAFSGVSPSEYRNSTQ